jgi:hypothetical protein
MDSQEVQDILNRGEGQQIEFKSDFPKQAHHIAKEIVALANSGGGILLMGVDDDGVPVGIEDPLKVDERLAGIARSCSPSLWIKIFCVNLNSDIDIVCARIPPTTCTTYQGKVYIRNGTTSVEAGGKDIEDMITRKLNPPDTMLNLDLESIEKMSKHYLFRKAWRGYFIRTIGIIICTLIVIGIYLNGNQFIWQAFFFIVLIITFYYFFIVLLGPYSKEINLYSKRPEDKYKVEFVGNGKLMEDDGTDEYSIYSRTAPCIYPNCHEQHEGMIVLVNAPQREVPRLRKSFVGICSIGDKDHSYAIDNIWNATKEKFDWRPLEKS